MFSWNSLLIRFNTILVIMFAESLSDRFGDTKELRPECTLR